jgi:hypothetical protein
VASSRHLDQLNPNVFFYTLNWIYCNLKFVTLKKQQIV